MKEDTHINYYTVLKDDNWLDTFMIFARNSSEWDSKYIINTNLFNLTNWKQVNTNQITIEKLLNVLIKMNLTYQFHNYYPFYYNYDTFLKPYDVTNHIHQGYMVKDTYTPIRLTKFWTYNFNRTINKRTKVKYLLVDVKINLILIKFKKY